MFTIYQAAWYVLAWDSALLGLYLAHEAAKSLAAAAAALPTAQEG